MIPKAFKRTTSAGILRLLLLLVLLLLLLHSI